MCKWDCIPVGQLSLVTTARLTIKSLVVSSKTKYTLGVQALRTDIPRSGKRICISIRHTGEHHIYTRLSGYYTFCIPYTRALLSGQRRRGYCSLSVTNLYRENLPHQMWPNIFCPATFSAPLYKSHPLKMCLADSA